MDLSTYRLTEPPVKEDIVLEHGPADNYIYSVRAGICIVRVPVWNDELSSERDGWKFYGRCVQFESHDYHRTPRHSGAPDYRRIYTWVL